MTMQRPDDIPSELFERAFSVGRLRQAWEHLRRKSPGPGIDRVTVSEYARNVSQRLGRLGELLRDGAWTPKPGMRVECKDDFARTLTIPTIEDRIVQRALATTLSEIYEPCLSDAAWAYRPGRSVHDVHRRINHQLGLGRPFFARTDIRKFFDTIDRDRLLDELDRDGLPGRVVRVVRKIVDAKAVEGVSSPGLDVGLSQGSSLSPLLSNVYLRPVDAAMEEGGFPYFRYADDMLVLGDAMESVDAALDHLGDVLADLGLELNLRKTNRGHVEDGFDYLGMHFDESGRRFSSDTLEALQERADALCEESGAHPKRVGGLLDEWENWYRPLGLGEVDSLGLLSGEVWRACRGGSQERVIEAAKHRLHFGLDVHLAPEFHADLLETWLAAGVPPSGVEGAGTVYRAAMLEAHLALKHTSRPSLRERIRKALAIPKKVLGDIASLEGDLPRKLAEAGSVTFGDAARGLVRLTERPLGIGAEAEEGAETDGKELVRVLEEVFQGHGSYHCVEDKDNREHWRYLEADGELGRKTIERHLNGGKRCGIYQADEDGLVHAAHLRVYVRRKHRLECRTKADREAGRAELEQWTRKTHMHAAAVARTAEKLGMPSLVEQPGGPGRRVWFLFEEPVSVRTAFLLMKKLVDEAGDSPEGTRQIAFPNQDKVKRGKGPYLALPFGRNPQTGRRSTLVELGGSKVEEPVRALREAGRVPSDTVDALVRVGPQHPEAEERRRRTVMERVEKFEHLPKIMNRCGILRMIADKAMRLGHVEPEERRTLFEVLGHLPGDEAQRGISSILSGCGRNDPDFVNKRIDRLGDYPVGCPKLGRRHEAYAEECGCECEFHDLPDDVYPTPLLHALVPKQVPVFREMLQDSNDGNGDPRTSPGDRSGANQPQQSAPRASKSDGEAEPEGNSEPNRQPAEASGESEEPTTADFEDALTKLSNVRRQMKDARRGMARVHEHLDGLFDAVDTERVELERGALVRQKYESPRFVIEI